MSAPDISSVKVVLQALGRLVTFNISFLKKWEAAGKDMLDLVDLTEDRLHLELMVDKVRYQVGTRARRFMTSGDVEYCFMLFGSQCKGMSYKELAQRARSKGFRLPTRSEILQASEYKQESWHAFVFDESSQRMLYTYLFQSVPATLHCELEHLPANEVPKMFGPHEPFLVVRDVKKEA